MRRCQTPNAPRRRSCWSGFSTPACKSIAIWDTRPGSSEIEKSLGKERKEKGFSDDDLDSNNDKKLSLDEIAKHLANEKN
jgi:hypothetical protein